MTAMEKKLDPAEFVRIRRSAIVRIDSIREFYPIDNGEFEVVLENGSVLSSTRRYKNNLQSILKP
jgi:DNA-binding LytR/AlgR family response regulator